MGRTLGRFALTVVGTGVGFLIGGPLGAAIGGGVGAGLGTFLFPPRVPTNAGPRIDDLTVQASTLGAARPYVAGAFRLAGQLIWLEGDQIEEIATTETVGGKGAPSQKVTNYSYKATFAVGLCDGLIAGVKKIWADRKLIYNDDADALETAVAGGDPSVINDASVLSLPGLTICVYRGTATQDPHPRWQADKGANRTPAHRGLAYAVFEDMPLDNFGARLPQLEFLVVTDAGEKFVQVDYPATARGFLDYQPQNNGAQGVYKRGSLYLTRLDDNVRAHDIASGQLVWQVDLPKYRVGFQNLAAEIVVDNDNGFAYVTHQTNDTFKAVVWQLDLATGAISGQWETSAGGGSRAHAVGRRSDGATYYYLFTTAELVVFDVSDSGPLGFPTGQIDVSVFTEFDDAFQAAVDRSGGLWWTTPSAANECILTGINVTTVFADGITYEVIFRLRSNADLGLTTGAEDGSFHYYEDEHKIVWCPMSEATDGATVLVDCADASTIVIQYSDGSDASLHNVLNFVCDGFSAGGFVYCFPRSDTPFSTSFYHILDLSAGVIEVSDINASDYANYAGVQSNAIYIPWLNGVIHTFLSGANGSNFNYFPRISENAVSLKSIVDAISVRCGLSVSGDLDTDDLASIDIRGYAVGRQMAGRDALIPLMDFKFVDAALIDGTIVYVPRGGAIAKAIPEADLGARRRGAGRPEKLEEKKQFEADLPWRLNVRFIDPARDWQENSDPDAKRADEAVTTRKELTQEFAVVMTADEAAQYGDKKLYQIWAEEVALTWRLGPKHGDVTPTDVVGPLSRGIVTYPRVRVEPVDEGADGVLNLAGVPDDASVYVSTRTGSSGDYTPATIGLGSAPGLLLFDIPSLRTEENADAWLYLSAYRLNPLFPFNGANIERSTDDVVYEGVLFDADSPNAGVTQTALTAPPSLWAWDRVNTLDVQMTSGALASAAELDVLNGANAALVGFPGNWRLMQWVTATDNGGGSYTLSQLARRRVADEDAALETIPAGAQFIPADAVAIERLAMPVSLVGDLVYFRARALTAAPQATVKSLTYQANNLRPFSPVGLAVSRDGSNNATVAWTRRSRYDDPWADGGEIALGETTEQYRVRYYSGATVVRTNIVTSPTDSYSAAQQTADGLTPGDPIKFDVAQYSGALADYGFEKEATL